MVEITSWLETFRIVSGLAAVEREHLKIHFVFVVSILLWLSLRRAGTKVLAVSFKCSFT